MQNNRILIIGMGEVGKAHYNLLKPVFGSNLYCRDMYEPIEVYMESFDDLIIAIRYDAKKFMRTVLDYEVRYNAKRVMVLSTVPPGTCNELGSNYCHSTTRGVHPNLEQGLLNIDKHIGGKDAKYWKGMFEKAGIKCHIHSHAKTTELAHILNNCAYGVSLMLADEMQSICRYYGVSYSEAVMDYTKTNNEGWVRFGDPTKTRYILTPPNGKIGGHCVVMSAGLIAEETKTEMIGKLAGIPEK